MMNELAVKQPSAGLKQKIDDIVRHIQNGAKLVDEVIAMGIAEGFSKQDISLMIRERMRSLGYNPRSIRRALPSSLKDTAKTRRDFILRKHDVNDNQSDEDTMSSYQNRNDCRENQSTRSITALEIKISTLEDQLKQEQSKYEDLSIRHNNVSDYVTQLWNQLHNEGVRTLILTGEKFPSNSSQVFESQDYVFVVEFKGTKVLDISMMSQQQAHDQYMNEKQVTKVL